MVWTTGVAAEGTFPEKREEEAPLKLIGNQRLVVGVLPEIGGRVVVIRHPDGDNLLDARPEEWTALPEGHPNPPHDLRWKQDRGQVIWLGPQQHFWEHQEILPEKRGAAWPPDPTITQAAYRVVEHQPDRIVLESPPSDIWGVVLRKTITARQDGTIFFEAEARNATERSIPKDLWFNLRARPDARVLVPVGVESDVRLDDANGVEGNLSEGFYALSISGDHEGPAAGKAFIDPSAGAIVAEYPEGYLVLRFEEAAEDEMAPGHAAVEIFRSRSAVGEELLELEQHGPLVELGPGDSMTHSETWQLLTQDEGQALLGSLRGE